MTFLESHSDLPGANELSVIHHGYHNLYDLHTEYDSLYKLCLKDNS